MCRSVSCFDTRAVRSPPSTARRPCALRWASSPRRASGRSSSPPTANGSTASSPNGTARGLHTHGAALLAEPVSSVMTAQVHTCRPNASVHDLAQTMTDHRVRHVPVVDGGVLIGIVSIGDVVKARLDELEEERKQLVDYIQTPEARGRPGREPGSGPVPVTAARGVRCGRGRASPGSAVRAGGVRDVGTVPALLPAPEAGRRAGDRGPPGALVAAVHRAPSPWCAAGRTCARWSPTAGGCSCWPVPPLIAANWLVFVYGVNSGHVGDCSGTSSTRW